MDIWVYIILYFFPFISITLHFYCSPYYCSITKGPSGNDKQQLIMIIYAFLRSILVTVTLLVLLNMIRLLEDPFNAHGLDCVRVKRDFIELRRILKECESDNRTTSYSNIMGILDIDDSSLI